jgi:hypothetical protein
MQALDEKGIIAETAYPGRKMPNISTERTAVSLEKVDYIQRTATVLVTAMVPISMGGGACDDLALRVGYTLERIGGVCVQEGCRINSYADAYYVRILATFRGSAVMDSWSVSPDFTVKVGTQLLENAVSFKAEQAVDELTGTPLTTAVWTFRIVEEFGRGEAPMPMPADPFTVVVNRVSSTETYSDCAWIACEIENTRTGLRQIRTGVSKSRDEIVII